MTMLALLLLSGLSQGPIGPEPHNGRNGQVDVSPPKLEATVTVDGALDEPVWGQAAVLTGFSQFTPVDGVAAADSTEVLVWYSSSALHLGVRAFDQAGAVRATLSQRDRIFGDDNIEFFLSTFNDGRQATFLAVNPLGVQADGAVNESGRGSSCNGFNCSVNTREGPDLSQDFVWQSKGRLTDWGYEVEIVVPLKSIRFQARDPQTWGINVLRVVQRSGQEQTWTPARLGQSSFLAQSGRLSGLSGLRTGRAIDIIPEFTSRVAGRAGTDGGWDYQGGKPEIGGNLRWGMTPNLTLAATANPDFSQVESDAGQFSFDPRQALFFPERRPFFLDGIEQFQVPNNLIYTRRIVQPVIATKLTGKAFGGTRVGVMAAVDDKAVSRSGEHPLFGVLRLQQDIGSGSQLGMVYTEQHDGDNANRVIGVDSRVVLGSIHSFTFSGAMAYDQVGGHTTRAPLWGASYRLNGRAFRARYTFGGIHDDFRTRTGFTSRTGFVNAVASHSYTWLRPEKLFESVTFEVLLNGTWQYQKLIHGQDVQDKKLHFNLNSQLRGGWNVGASILDESFGYDEALYANYGLLQPDGSVTEFVGQARIPNRDYLVSFNSPALSWGSFNGFVLWGNDENFAEWASAPILWINGGVTLTPTDKLRAGFSLTYTKVNRPTDGTRVSLQTVPRARLEYQLSRAFQVRLISQYALETQDSLRDNTRTELPIVVRDGSGEWVPARGFRNGQLRNDLLLTYLPNPGTVFYLGYGASHLENPEDRAPSQSRFTRQGDAFFLKVSYLFRMAG